MWEDLEDQQKKCYGVLLCYESFIYFMIHTKSQWDSLCHVFCQKKYYEKVQFNNLDRSSIETMNNTYI